jgi:hypothetical protein
MKRHGGNIFFSFESILAHHLLTMDVQLGRSGETQDCDHVILHGRKLKISFHRTVRVTDNKDVSDMPPDFGTFPLLPVGGFKKVPNHVVKMGGVMLPMYREFLGCLG